LNLILVIEDDKDIRDSISEVLDIEGYPIVSAGNGQEGLSYLNNPANPLPSVILLDLMMPVMNGMAFRSLQLKDPRLAAIPVIVMSADNRAVQKSEEMKSATCILKPLEIDDLLREIKRLIHSPA
jgi:CheY-like chemotaxis protein